MQMTRASPVLLLTTCIALIGMNGLVLSPVLTDIARDFGVAAPVAGRAIAAYGAGVVPAALLLGRHLDRFGQARALRLAMLAAALAQGVSALSGGWVMLALAQALAGAAAGVGLPAIYGLAAALSPRGAESRTMSRVIFGWAVALVAAVPLGAALGDLMGWRAVLWAAGGLCLLAGFLVGRIGQVARAEVEPGGIFAPLLLPGAGRQFSVCFLYMGAFYGLYAYCGDHVRGDFAVTASGAGLVALTYGLGLGFTSRFGHVLDRVPRGRALPVLLAAGVAVNLGLGLVPGFTGFLAMAFAWGMVNHLSLNMIITGLNQLAPGARGAVLGVYSAVTYVAATLAVLGFGALYGLAGFAAAGIAAALALLLALLIETGLRAEAAAT